MKQSAEVDGYLKELDPKRRTALAELRSLILETVPSAIETMRYRMPTYEYGGSVLCAFASQKHYMSLYLDTSLVEKYREELAGLNLGKSCIRFRRLVDLPLETVRLMLNEALQSWDNV